MKRLRLKKSVKKIILISIVVIIFSSLGLFSFFKIKAQKEYEATNEYKLQQKGYNAEEVKNIIGKFKEAEIKFILNNEKNENYLQLSQEQYFIYDKFYDYLNYFQEHPDLSLRNVIEIINTNTHKEYYTDPEKTDISKKELMLVNKYNYLESDYVPENLVSIPPTYAYGEYGSQKATQNTYDAFLSLWNASHAAGYYLMVNSSYRTHEKQQSVYDEYANSKGSEYADSIAARPGFSEHQTGYTLDVFEKGSSQSSFQDSPSYEWLKENAHNYGFILRYPQDKENITGYSFESWHIRYVGVEAATYIYENNITFDEYYAYFVK